MNKVIITVMALLISVNCFAELKRVNNYNDIADSFQKQNITAIFDVFKNAQKIPNSNISIISGIAVTSDGTNTMQSIAMATVDGNIVLRELPYNNNIDENNQKIIKDTIKNTDGFSLNRAKSFNALINQKRQEVTIGSNGTIKVSPAFADAKYFKAYNNIKVNFVKNAKPKVINEPTEREITVEKKRQKKQQDSWGSMLDRIEENQKLKRELLK